MTWLSAGLSGQGAPVGTGGRDAGGVPPDPAAGDLPVGRRTTARPPALAAGRPGRGAEGVAPGEAGLLAAALVGAGLVEAVI